MVILGMVVGAIVLLCLVWGMMEDEMGLGVLAAGVVLLVALIGVGLNEQDKREAALMASCLRDHKDYECASMLKHPDPPMVITMPVVVGR